VPNVSVIIGEGGSGGAIAIATANQVYMLEHSIYSVISPEGAASILWRDSTRAKDAATSMKITAQDLLELKVIDGIIPEPVGGAHRSPETVIAATGEQIDRAFKELARANMDFREHRREKFLAIGRNL
jgi:acetyl-CoA carboxylase carboxyl transferase subunit alpha